MTRPTNPFSVTDRPITIKEFHARHGKLSTGSLIGHPHRDAREVLQRIALLERTEQQVGFCYLGERHWLGEAPTEAYAVWAWSNLLEHILATARQFSNGLWELETKANLKLPRVEAFSQPTLPFDDFQVNIHSTCDLSRTRPPDHTIHLLFAIFFDPGYYLHQSSQHLTVSGNRRFWMTIDACMRSPCMPIPGNG